MKPIEMEKLKAKSCPLCYFDWKWRSHDDLWRFRCNSSKAIDKGAIFSNPCSLKDYSKCPLREASNDE